MGEEQKGRTVLRSPLAVAVVGMGAIGSPLAVGLVAAPGIGRLRLIDGDRVERSNLPRQPWYQESDVGLYKAPVLARQLGPRARSRGIMVESVVAALTEANAPDVLGEGLDLILDGTDNWDARLVIDRWAYAHGIPWVFASAVGLTGMTHLFLPGDPCLYCLFGSPLQEGPRCFEVGVLGGITLAVAGEALELVRLWRRDPTAGGDRLMLVDALTGRREIRLPHGMRCPHRRAAP